MFEGAAGAPADVGFFEALGDFVAAGVNGTDPEADSASGDIVFDIERVSFVVFAETDGRLGIKRSMRLKAGGRVAVGTNEEIAFVHRIRHAATGKIAAIGIELGLKVHVQVIERATNNRGRVVRIVLARKHE